MTIDASLIPWGVSVFTVLGLIWAFSARVATIETKLDLLYKIYIEEKLKQRQDVGMAERKSPWRVTKEGELSLNQETLCKIRTKLRGDTIDKAVVSIAADPELKRITEEEATEKGMFWGELLVMYALYATKPEFSTDKKLSLLQKIWRGVWP